MKLRFLILIISLVVFVQPALPQQAGRPLALSQLMDLVRAGMGTPELVKLIQEHGVDFDLTDDKLQALRAAGAQEPVVQALRAAKPKPLSKEQVLQLVAGGVPSRRTVVLVEQHSIDFVADDPYLETLRLAGADDELIAALREASKALEVELVVLTSPGANVYLDGTLRGKASDQGGLTLKAPPGVHALKVSLEGMKDFAQSVTLAARQANMITARLEEITTNLAVVTSPGAEIYLDGALQGKASNQGELAVNARPGPHALKVVLKGKKDFAQSVTLVAGQATKTEARLEDLGPTPGELRANPKDGLKYVWIPAGTFLMGCSPADSKCEHDELPPHQVTLTKGFWMGQTEITVSAYKRFAAAVGREMPNPHRYNPGWEDEKKPMYNATWDDAHDYCVWAGGRLPTEAEWEYAARGGGTLARYGDMNGVAWWGQNSHSRPQDVALLQPNGFGLFDVLGNVLEWVNDWYDSGYYLHSPATDPPGPPQGKTHVLRGASWMDYQWMVRVSNRGKFVADGAWKNIYRGCRCVWEQAGP